MGPPPTPSEGICSRREKAGCGVSYLSSLKANHPPAYTNALQMGTLGMQEQVQVSLIDSTCPSGTQGIHD
jgi:hypothetical protein